MTDPSPEIDGFELKIGLLNDFVTVFVTCVNVDVFRLNTKTSGFPCLSGAVGSRLPTAGTRSRVEIKAMMPPSSLIVASRLSSAINGGQQTELALLQFAIVKPDKIPPGEGA